MLIDIHVHSKHSKRPSQWVLKKLGCPESFSEPLQIYQIAKYRGMTHVTISDHNTIDGALEIAHLPDTFISEEITTYFPEDGCKIHVLALNISQNQHHEIQKIRQNIFDLAHYLKGENILSIVAHPLYAVNDRLTIAHFEQLLLLFAHFELNGARNKRENICLRRILETLTPETIATLADTHDISPLHPFPWQKKLWAGSDDHSSLNITRSHTYVAGVEHPRQFFADTVFSEIKISGRESSPQTMAHNLYGIAYQFYCSKFNLNRYTEKDVLMHFLDRNLRVNPDAHGGLFSRLYLLWQYRKEKRMRMPVSDTLLALLRHETRQLIQTEPIFSEDKINRMDFDHQEEHWYAFVNRVSNQVMLSFGNHLLDHVSGANFFNIFSTIGSAGGLYALLAPYFVAFAQFSKDRMLSETIVKHFNGSPTDSHSSKFIFAHFTDTFYEVNGVAKTLQQQVYYAHKNNKSHILITCHENMAENPDGVINFRPIGTYELPEYPEQKIFFPPFLEMLTYCYESRVNHIHVATPGPLGLAGLAIAKILKLPISGTYHTAIPQYAEILTNDSGIAELSWKYVLWFYDQLDVIYAPSQSTKDELVAKGLSSSKIRLYPRGIDITFFHPEKRNAIFKKEYPLPEGIKLLYVGRVSKEKNLNLLAEAFRNLIREENNIQMVVVGDGPYLEDMKRDLEGLPCCFTGYQSGETLAALYASADLFVFPSTTDTFGNVVLEAQASGLPVIVSDQGGPCENMRHEKTGLVCKGNDGAALSSAIGSLAGNLVRLRQMGIAARQYVEERSFEAAFLKMWELYQDPISCTTRANHKAS